MIKTLPKNVANQIAAGEVVERPASIVKELVENSIDAGADDIRIYIKEFGVSKVQIIDNGIGIAKSDFANLFKKHATSKISNIEDLGKINSFGFRGEALASISSVSKITLQTRNQEDPNGSEIIIDYGEKSEIKPSSIEKGTNIIVEDLFKNIPARKKFLKSKNTENKAIIDIIYKFILSNPNISFHIDIDGTVKTFPKGNVKERISQILKIKADDLIEIQYEGNVRIDGFLIHPRIFMKNRNNQYIFVNKRPVQDSTIGKAIIDGFGTFLMKQQYPAYVIFLDLPTEEVDVNVHPRKIEVRFNNSAEIYKSVRFLINQKLMSNMREETREKLVEIKEETRAETKNNDFEDFLRSPELKSQKQNINNPSQWLTEKAIKFNKEIMEVNVVNEKSLTLDYKADFNTKEDDKFLIDFENATQLMNSYIVTANNEGILIIDQHAASERYFYEKYLSELRLKKVESKVLLVPETIEFETFEIPQIMEYENILNNFGFRIELFGNDTIRILEVPNFIKMDNFSNIFHIIIHEILDYAENSNVEDKIFHEIAAILACHTAVRFGDKLTKNEIIQILKNLIKCEDPYNCPHGRPIIQDFSSYDVEKKFKRCSI